MAKQVQIIKTLNHLIPLHLSEQKIVMYSIGYSPQLAKYLAGLGKVNAPTYTKLLRGFQQLDWEKVTLVSKPQEYAVRGSSISFWLPGYPAPIRAEFDFEDLENIYTYDSEYGRKLYNIESFLISKYKLDDEDIESIKLNEDADSEEFNTATFVNSKPQIINDEVETQFMEYDYSYPQLFWSRLDLLTKELNRFNENGYQISIQSRHIDTLPDEVIELVSNSEAIQHLPKDLPAGFVSARQKTIVLTDREIFGTVYLAKRKKLSSNSARLLSQFEGEISVGDYIVHEDHGIAIYAGLTQEQIGDEMQEYLSLKYAGDDQLLIPVDQVHKLTKYIGDDTFEPKLSKLGRAEWEGLKARTKKAVGILARDLISHYAKREVAKAEKIFEEDSKEYTQFVDEFKYTATQDQLHATNEILSDLQKDVPMNRLLVGDVGFGKTEVMMRATFKAVEAGYQVAILCPTTVLCAQHFGVFSERFKNFPYRIAYLSRFNTAQENNAIIEKVNKGEVDIIIATHALLRSDVKYKKLGLLIVDEEQRFGVAQKEKIKKLNYGVHHLSVSATPIPRTLGMALSSIQDISLITQAPKGRKPITTEVEKLSWQRIGEAIRDEMDRGGQVYFVHNRVQDIQSLELKLQNAVPGIKVTVAHGQMHADELDRRITDFYSHKSDVLLCTTIIENGIDMPNVNTIIVHQAEMFGLSQLYQLRGRVGRSERQAYCYLFYQGKSLLPSEQAKYEIHTDTKGKDSKTKKPDPNYIKRLEAMAQATDLGAGFSIASRDLEIRGAGNLLGAEQHGHISQVGYALYMQMLNEEVEHLKQVTQEIIPLN